MIGATSFRARFAALPDVVRGALWMSAASFFFALIYLIPLSTITISITITITITIAHPGGEGGGVSTPPL